MNSRQGTTRFVAPALAGFLSILSAVFAAGAAFADGHAGDGMIALQSANDVKTTMDRLETLLKEKNMTVFARIDHADGASGAGLELGQTELLIFGNPKVGTPLMQCARSVAIDLPQKALAWQDDAGQVWLAYNDPKYLGDRHGLGDCAAVLEKVGGALANFAGAAAAAP